MFEKKDDVPPEVNRKRLRLYVWIFLIVSLLSMAFQGLWSEYRRYNPMSPAEYVNKKHAKDPYSPSKHVRINGVDYAIPLGYFWLKVPVYTQSTGFGFTAILPDLAILPVSERRLYEEKRYDNVIRMLANDPTLIWNPERDPKKGPDLEKAAEFSMEQTHHRALIDHQFGLEVYGLAKGERAAWKESDVPLIHRENGKIATVISCGQRLCAHSFYDGYLTYQLSYFAVNLRDWKKIQDKVSQLFRGFRERAAQLKLDKVRIPEKLIDPMYYDIHPRNIDSLPNGVKPWPH